ncbi:hypothetical protein [Streptomyces sp. AC555_RSS877]|uniref:hypothetical protein n=1 Tax=Streptomyces sp. AC555_RSS877 TaxID=2823688 RepID=UPI001C269019|nr:hypothetical protein [Streptomyces sp. AC555_RSS877]
MPIATALSLAEVLDGCPEEEFVVWLDEYSAYLFLGHLDADTAQTRIRTGYTIDPETLEHRHIRFDRHEHDSCGGDIDDCGRDCHEQPWWVREAPDGIPATMVMAWYSAEEKTTADAIAALKAM